MRCFWNAKLMGERHLLFEMDMALSTEQGGKVLSGDVSETMLMTSGEEGRFIAVFPIFLLLAQGNVLSTNHRQLLFSGATILRGMLLPRIHKGLYCITTFKMQAIKFTAITL